MVTAEDEREDGREVERNNVKGNSSACAAVVICGTSISIKSIGSGNLVLRNSFKTFSIKLLFLLRLCATL